MTRRLGPRDRVFRLSDGSWGGFRTSYYRYLTADRSTVILSNRGDFDADDFWYPLNDLIEEHLEE